MRRTGILFTALFGTSHSSQSLFEPVRMIKMQASIHLAIVTIFVTHCTVMDVVNR